MIEHIGHKSTHIAVVPDIVSPDVCNELLEACRKDWEKLFYPGPTLAGVDPTIKLTMDFDFSGHQAAEKGADYATYQYPENKIAESLRTSISLYLEAYSELKAAPSLRDLGFRLQRYTKGSGFYRSHHDGAPWDPEPTCNRILGIVIYLNTVERGGETWFPLHDVKVKARAGSIAIFPATWTHPHQSCVPISSDKWIVSSFILSDKRPPSVNEPQQSKSVPDAPVTLIDTNPENQSAQHDADQ
jgi:hypothetical protein